MSTKNPCGRTRDVEAPYEVWESADGLSEWRVLKKHRASDDHPHALWNCAVRTPNTFGSWEYGDVPVSEVKRLAHQTFVDPTVFPDFFAGIRPEPHGCDITIPDPDQPRTTLYKETFPFLVDYFTENGMSFHVSDVTGRLRFFFSLPIQECAQNLQINWGMICESDGDTGLEVTLVIFDQPDDPLRVPFLFDLTKPQQAYESIQLVEQDCLNFSLLSVQDNGSLGFIGERTMVLPDEVKQEFSTVIRDALRRVQA